MDISTNQSEIIKNEFYSFISRLLPLLYGLSDEQTTNWDRFADSVRKCENAFCLIDSSVVYWDLDVIAETSTLSDLNCFLCCLSDPTSVESVIIGLSYLSHRVLTSDFIFHSNENLSVDAVLRVCTVKIKVILPSGSDKDEIENPSLSCSSCWLKCLENNSSVGNSFSSSICGSIIWTETVKRQENKIIENILICRCCGWVEIHIIKNNKTRIIEFIFKNIKIRIRNSYFAISDCFGCSERQQRNYPLPVVIPQDLKLGVIPTADWLLREWNDLSAMFTDSETENETPLDPNNRNRQRESQPAVEIIIPAGMLCGDIFLDNPIGRGIECSGFFELVSRPKSKQLVCEVNVVSLSMLEHGPVVIKNKEISSKKNLTEYFSNFIKMISRDDPSKIIHIAQILLASFQPFVSEESIAILIFTEEDSSSIPFLLAQNLNGAFMTCTGRNEDAKVLFGASTAKEGYCQKSGLVAASDVIVVNSVERANKQFIKLVADFIKLDNHILAVGKKNSAKRNRPQIFAAAGRRRHEPEWISFYEQFDVSVDLSTQVDIHQFDSTEFELIQYLTSEETQIISSSVNPRMISKVRAQLSSLEAMNVNADAQQLVFEYLQQIKEPASISTVSRLISMSAAISSIRGSRTVDLKDVDLVLTITESVRSELEASRSVLPSASQTRKPKKGKGLAAALSSFDSLLKARTMEIGISNIQDETMRHVADTASIGTNVTADAIIESANLRGMILKTSSREWKVL